MRANYSREIVDLLHSTYGSKLRIFDSIIPLSIRAAETSAEGKSIYLHDPAGKVAAAYRGYATGHVNFYDDEVLDVSKAAGFLCEGCMNKILPSQFDRYFGVGAINLATKEVRVFEEHLRGFGLGDFYIDCDLQDRDGDTPRINLLIFYCPIRFEKES